MCYRAYGSTKERVPMQALGFWSKAMPSEIGMSSEKWLSICYWGLVEMELSSGSLELRR